MPVAYAGAYGRDRAFGKGIWQWHMAGAYGESSSPG